MQDYQGGDRASSLACSRSFSSSEAFDRICRPIRSRVKIPRVVPAVQWQVRKAMQGKPQHCLKVYLLGSTSTIQLQSRDVMGYGVIESLPAK